MRLTFRTIAVLSGVAILAFVGSAVMLDLKAHMYWMKVHRTVLDLDEPDRTDREERLLEAEEMLTKALETSPDRADIWFDLGYVAESLRDIYRDRDGEKHRRLAKRHGDLCESSYARAASLSRENARYRLALAWAATENQIFIRRRLDDADFHRLDGLFSTASRLSPRDPTVQFSCGCFWLMGQRLFDRKTRSRAVDAYARCIAANPDRWLPLVRAKFTHDPPSIEEMYRLVGPRRDLIRRIQSANRACVTPLRHHVAAATGGQQ